MIKQNVVFIGFQEYARSLPLAQVNDETGSTRTYRPELHSIVNTSTNIRALVDRGSQGKPDVRGLCNQRGCK